MSKFKKALIISSVAILIILILAAFCLFFINTAEKRYNEALNTTPQNSQIETEMGDYLFSSHIEVNSHEKRGDKIFYLLRVYNTDTAHSYQYCEVLYKLERYNTGLGAYYKWVYYSHKWH